jgi:hypothetical protein
VYAATNEANRQLEGYMTAMIAKSMQATFHDLPARVREIAARDQARRAAPGNAPDAPKP